MLIDFGDRTGIFDVALQEDAVGLVQTSSMA